MKVKFNHHFLLNLDLYEFLIFPHGIRMTGYQKKGMFIQHILKEYSNEKAIFVDNNVKEISSAIDYNDNLHATFLYLGDKE